MDYVKAWAPPPSLSTLGLGSFYSAHSLPPQDSERAVPSIGNAFPSLCLSTFHLSFKLQLKCSLTFQTGWKPTFYISLPLYTSPFCDNHICKFIFISEFVVWSLSRVWLFCDPLDCSPPGSSVHGISQARILEWVAASFSRRSSQPRDRTQVSCIADRFFTAEPPDLIFIFHIKN